MELEQDLKLEQNLKYEDAVKQLERLSLYLKKVISRWKSL